MATCMNPVVNRGAFDMRRGSAPLSTFHVFIVFFMCFSFVFFMMLMFVVSLFSPWSAPEVAFFIWVVNLWVSGCAELFNTSSRSGPGHSLEGPKRHGNSLAFHTNKLYTSSFGFALDIQLIPMFVCRLPSFFSLFWGLRRGLHLYIYIYICHFWDSEFPSGLRRTYIYTHTYMCVCDFAVFFVCAAVCAVYIHIVIIVIRTPNLLFYQT